MHLIAAGTVEESGDGVEVSADGHRIRITARREDGAVVVPSQEVWELDDPELIAVWGAVLTRLAYDLPDAAGTLTTVIEELS